MCIRDSFCSAAAPDFEEQSRVLRIGVGWSDSTTDRAGRHEFHHCFGAGGGAGGAVSSSAGRDACRCTGGEFTKSVVCWLVVLSSRRAVRVLWGVSACAACAAVESSGDGGASKVPVEFEDKYVPAELCLPG